MPLMGCDVPTLLVNAKCYSCLPDGDLQKAKLRYRELIYSRRANTPLRTGSQLLAASVAWSRLSAHQLLAIDVAQLANDAVLLGAITSPSPQALLEATACYCGAGTGDVLAANEYLKCLIRQEG